MDRDGWGELVNPSPRCLKGSCRPKNAHETVRPGTDPTQRTTKEDELPEETYRLRRSVGSLSGGTRVRIRDTVGPYGRRVETLSPIPIITQNSYFDGDGVQRNVIKEVGREHVELLVDRRDLVRERNRNR